jgi:type II secretory pathway component GspD/PulD (secretin)
MADAGVMKIIQLNNRTAEDIVAIITPLLDPQDRVIANGNALIIKTTPARHKTLAQLISKLDVPIQNLIITVVQDRHSTADSLNAGANISLYGRHSNRGTSVRGNLHGHIDQFQGQSNLHNNQTLRTIEGSPAHIKVGSAHPIRQTQVYHPPYGYPEVTTTTDYIEASTGFAVTPRLAGNNQVIIDVAPWSDRFNRYGQIETQGAQTTLRVNLGEWVEIGGVTEESNSQRSGLFSNSYRNQNTSLHIIIKVDKAP